MFIRVSVLKEPLMNQIVDACHAPCKPAFTEKQGQYLGVNPENETSKMGTVLMGGTVCYDEIADIQPGVQGCGGISD